MMTSEVIVDGIKYVPESKVQSIQIKTIRKVLESQKYLSEDAIDEIIKALDDSTAQKKDTMKQKWGRIRKNDQFKYGANYKTLFNISDVLSNGGVLYKSRKSPVTWNIQQAILIRKAMNNDSIRGLSYSDVNEIVKRVKLSKNLVVKIMYNIEFGDLTKEIEKWKVKYNQKKITDPKPIQNNPQKRRESGALYV